MMQATLPPLPDPVEGLVGYGSGLASVLILGAIKKYTTIGDRAVVGKVFKKAQPLIAMAISLGLPVLAGAVGIEVDAQQFIAAPVTTLTAIGARELLTLAKRRSL